MTDKKPLEAEPQPPLPASPLVTDKEKVDLAVDAWKTTVSVQQHFNDLELRIRNFAITFAAAVLGLVGLALKEDPKSLLPAALLGIGTMAWAAFYLMDRLWYHRFLDAAGEHARRVEEWLGAATGTHVFNLAGGIKKKSAIQLAKCKLRSHHRIDIFYGAFAVASAVLAVVFYCHAGLPRDNRPVEVVLRAQSGAPPLPLLAVQVVPPVSQPRQAVEELICSPDNH